MMDRNSDSVDGVLPESPLTIADQKLRKVKVGVIMGCMLIVILITVASIIALIFGPKLGVPDAHAHIWSNALFIILGWAVGKSQSKVKYIPNDPPERRQQ